MHQLLAERGIPVVRQTCTHSLEAVKTFIHEVLNDEYPLVLKPVDSSGSDGFHKC